MKFNSCESHHYPKARRSNCCRPAIAILSVPFSIKALKANQHFLGSVERLTKRKDLSTFQETL
jgi:hypothetical protein